MVYKVLSRNNIAKSDAQSSTTHDRAEQFFNAELVAGMYDETIDLVVPEYARVHGLLHGLLAQHVKSRGLPDAPIAVLDIGSGTGAEAIQVLQSHPQAHVLALDLCERMHTELRKRLDDAEAGSGHLSSRCAQLTADFLSETCRPESLLHHSALPRAGAFDVVMTAFTVHHLGHEDKQRAYARACQLLKPGGLFLNGDLFGYADSTLSALAHEFDISWIRKQFENPDPAFSRAENIAESRRHELRDLWVKHYEQDNIVEPIESEGGQYQMLTDAGFSQVAVPFRYWQVGLLYAVK